jgi:hypothetical protein
MICPSSSARACIVDRFDGRERTRGGIHRLAYVKSSPHVNFEFGLALLILAVVVM